MKETCVASLERELEATRRELHEATAVLTAIRQGEVDALVVETAGGPRVFTLRSADEPYRTIVETLKEGAMTVSGDGVILYCNDALTRLLRRDASTLIGADVTRVVDARTFEGLTRGVGTGGCECSLARSDGRLLECQISSASHQAEGETIWCLLVTDLTEQALRLRHNAIIESTDDAVMSFDCAGRINSWNAAAERLFGYTAAEAIGANADLLVAPLGRIPEGETARGAFDEAITGRRFHKETQLVAKDGTVIDVSATASPLRAPDGTITGVSAIMRDVREKNRAHDRELLLMREVNHRSKNMLGVVQAIARQTAAGNPTEFVEKFAHRIQALSASQDVLIESGWRHVPVDALVRAQLSHFADVIGSRIVLSGPSLDITAAAAQTIGLALHELATNAAKYGALSNSSGIVDVSWAVVANGSAPRFTLSWLETGGPPVVQPQRLGYGSKVTGSLVKVSLDGDVETEFASSGLKWRLACLLDTIAENSQRTTQRKTSDNEVANDEKDRPQILVVEDEPLLAMEIAATLEQGGFKVLGPVGTVAQALLLLSRSGCDGAVLDVNLGIETAEPIAVTLLRMQTPFVTVSGYARDQLPACFINAPLVGKPIQPDRLLTQLRQCLDPPNSATKAATSGKLTRV